MERLDLTVGGFRKSSYCNDFGCKENQEKGKGSLASRQEKKNRSEE